MDKVTVTYPLPVLFVHCGDNWIRGSERCLLDLLANVNRERFAPIVWCNASAMADHVRAMQLPVYVERFPILFGWGAPRFDFRQYFALIDRGCKLAQKHATRLIHANSGGPAQWSLAVARTLKIPLVAHLHAPYLRRDRYTLGLHQVSLATCVSQAVANDLLADGMPQDSVCVIHNGVDRKRTLAGCATELRAAMGIPSSAVTITAVGSLIRRKGVDLILRAIHNLSTCGTDVHGIIVGEGEQRRALEELTAHLCITPRIHFMGERADVGSIYRDATDIAVLASRSEAFGLVLLEAAACGIPAIATAVGGIPEVVVHGETGLLVPANDPVALAQSLQFLVRSPDERKRLGEQARRRFERDFSVERMVQAFEAQYLRLLEGSNERFGWSGKWNGLKPYLKLARAFY